MTQLLISVKNIEESRIARYADVDLIDLKDPSVGALGALDVDVVRDIVNEVGANSIVSATVGEGHKSIDALKADILLYAGLGVDIVKIAVSDLFQQDSFVNELKQLTQQGIKVVAVFFADKTLDFSLIAKLQKSGFYGAMLDTQFKQSSLLGVQPIETLGIFVANCKQHGLISGLAGSVNKSYIGVLLPLEATFIGMRGGVCQQQDRTATLAGSQIEGIKKVLLNYNTVEM